MDLYKKFDGEKLKIASKIKQRRLQMLIHSYLYYELNTNIVSDATWMKWARELAELQNKYPEISDVVEYSSDFKDWDGSTGAFLPLQNNWVISKANTLLAMSGKSVVKPKQSPKKEKQKTTFKLF